MLLISSSPDRTSIDYLLNDLMAMHIIFYFFLRNHSKDLLYNDVESQLVGFSRQKSNEIPRGFYQIVHHDIANS